MDKPMIRAYLMDEVIRLGFLPTSAKDKKSWLHQYNQSLMEFWCVEDYPHDLAQKGENLIVTIDSSKNINVTYECTIQNNNNFVVRLIHSPDQQLMWSHDMDDGKYY